jgi:hypothetical protein
VLQPENVLLILVQPFQVFHLLGDLAVFIFFDLLVVLVKLDLFDVAF